MDRGCVCGSPLTAVDMLDNGVATNDSSGRGWLYVYKGFGVGHVSINKSHRGDNENLPPLCPT